eukprot:505572-Amphidinium_carterae.9
MELVKHPGKSHGEKLCNIGQIVWLVICSGDQRSNVSNKKPYLDGEEVCSTLRKAFQQYLQHASPHSRVSHLAMPPAPVLPQTYAQNVSS